MNLAPILAVLKAGLTGYRIVGGAADLAAVEENNPVTPAAYVAPLTEAARDNEEIGGHSQAVDAEFAVFLFLTAKRDATGGAGLDDLDQRTKALDALLLGQVLGDAVTPIAYVSGNVLSFKDGVLLWAAHYRTRYYKRKAS